MWLHGWDFFIPVMTKRKLVMSKNLYNKRLLTIEEAAEYYGCHPDTIRRHVKAGTIKSMKLGRVYRISRMALDRLVERNVRLPVPSYGSKNTQLPAE